jgi:hypothetical protein
MKKTMLIMMFGLFQMPVFAETNILIEVKLFKDWMIKDERMWGSFNLAIKNTETEPLRLFKHPFDFEVGQLAVRTLPHNTNMPSWVGERREQDYQGMALSGAWKVDGCEVFFELPPGETHVYEGRKFSVLDYIPFSEEMRFTVSVYLGKGFWLDSEPVIIKGVVPDSEEYLATITDVNGSRDLVTVTYKNERWLYTKLSRVYAPRFPLSLTNKIRVEPHGNTIWDGDKSIKHDINLGLISEAPDENNVFGKWTRERKQRAETDNAEVRRKKTEAGN